MATINHITIDMPEDTTAPATKTAEYIQANKPQSVAERLRLLPSSIPDLSRLTTREKERYLALLDEAMRREREERIRYLRLIQPSDPNPFGIPSVDQYGLIHSLADERWVFGGNRSSKTESLVIDALWFAQGEHPTRSKRRRPPVKIRVTAPSWRENIVSVILEKFKQMCPRQWLRGGSWEDGWRENRHTLFFENGSMIQFKSCDEDIDTFKGMDLDAVYHDEHIPYKFYLENKSRLIDRGGFFFASMTPELGITWEDSHVTNPPDDLTLEYWFFDVRGNPYVNEKAVRQQMSLLANTALYDAKIKGMFTVLSGLVVPQFVPDIHIVKDFDIPLKWTRTFCIDTHTKKPSAAMWVAWSPEGEAIVYRTIKRFLDVPGWQKLIRTKSAGENIQLWLMDEPGGGQGVDINNMQSIENQFNSGPNAIPVVRVNKDSDNSFYAGILKLWEFFKCDPITGKTKVKIFESCNHFPYKENGHVCYSLPGELRRYAYKKEQKADEETLREKVRRVDDHYIDDYRYILMAGMPVGDSDRMRSAYYESW